MSWYGGSIIVLAHGMQRYTNVHIGRRIYMDCSTVCLSHACLLCQEHTSETKM